MAVFFLLGELLLSAFLGSLDFPIRYVQWGCQLEAVAGRSTPAVQRPRRGTHQSWTSAWAKSHWFSWKRGKDFSFLPLVFASKSSLVMCLWSGHNGQTRECSWGGGAYLAVGNDASAALPWRASGGSFSVVARDAFKIPMLCAWNGEKLTFWLSLWEWSTWFTALLQHSSSHVYVERSQSSQSQELRLGSQVVMSSGQSSPGKPLSWLRCLVFSHGANPS